MLPKSVNLYRDHTCFSMHKHLLDPEGGVDDPLRGLADVGVSENHV